MKIPPLGAEYFHENGITDGRTDITMLVVTFRNFAKAPIDLVLILKIILFATSWYLIFSSFPSFAYVNYWLSDHILCTVQYCVLTVCRNL